MGALKLHQHSKLAYRGKGLKEVCKGGDEQGQTSKQQDADNHFILTHDRSGRKTFVVFLRLESRKTETKHIQGNEI